MKRVLVLVIAVVLAIGLIFVGCKPEAIIKTVTEKVTETVEVEVEVEVEAPAEEVAPAAEAEPITITMWDYQTAEGWNDAYNAIIELFQVYYPNVTIERLAQTHEAGEEVVKASLLAGDYPDLVPIEPGFFMSTVEAGYIIDLEPYIQSDPIWASWVDGYKEDIAVKYNGEGHWRIAADTYHIVVFYFKDIVEQYGLIDPALTVADFEENAAILEPEGILPLGNTYQGNYQAAHCFGTFVSQQVGNNTDAWHMFEQACMGEISWQNDIFKTALEGVAKLYDHSSDDAIALGYDESILRIMEKKGVYHMYLGSWMISDIETQLADDVAAGNVGTLLYPAVTDDVDTYFYGSGLGCQYSVSSQIEGAQLEATLAWAKFINSPQASAIFLQHSIMPIGAPVKNLDEIVSPFFADYLEVVYTGKGCPEYNPGFFDVKPEVTDSFYNNFARLLTGEITVDGYVEDMDIVCGFGG